MSVSKLKKVVEVEIADKRLSGKDKKVIRPLPIGRDDFREIRENDLYYVDKTLMIKDFIDMKDKLALITRPRRFGKTLNMTMIRDFFDITQDSRDIFRGLAIMDTEYANQINSRPVIYISFKDCKDVDKDGMFDFVKEEFYREYRRFEKVIRDRLDDPYDKENFYSMLSILHDQKSSYHQYRKVLLRLMDVVSTVFKTPVLVLIDEYDQPIMSSYEYGYRSETGNFFSNLYGSAMKGNPALGQALLTGVQRVAKESIFSQFNNAKVYTVMSGKYSPYFGLTMEETAELLNWYQFELDDSVKNHYDGYLFGGVHVYNPWSVLNYSDTGVLDNYWVNTSTNYLIKELLTHADSTFWPDFDKLASGRDVPVELTLETAYIESMGIRSLWGLLVNSGYLTAIKRIDANTAAVRIPNEEVMSEFKMIVTEIAGVKGTDLNKMFNFLLNKEMDGFLTIYKNIVISCTSYMDAKENAYHMLFLGMTMYLRGIYNIKSNLESGHGRADIIMAALKPLHSHMIIEFKQGKEEELDKLKIEALQQIFDNEYYAGLKGEVLCIDIAHDKKHCCVAHQTIQV